MKKPISINKVKSQLSGILILFPPWHYQHIPLHILSHCSLSIFLLFFFFFIFYLAWFMLFQKRKNNSPLSLPFLVLSLSQCHVGPSSSPPYDHSTHLTFIFLITIKSHHSLLHLLSFFMHVPQTSKFFSFLHFLYVHISSTKMNKIHACHDFIIR